MSAIMPKFATLSSRRRSFVAAMGKLRWFVTQLAAIDHLDVVRIGTRVR